MLRALILSVVLVTGCVNSDAPVHPGDDAELVFEVPSGSSATGLGPALVAEGLVSSELKWKLFLRQTDASCLKAGRFTVRRSMSLNELLATLCGTPMADDVPFTVLEGWRIRDIDAALAAEGWIDEGEFTTVAEAKAVDAPFDVPSTTLEGYLYPETYMVSPTGFTPERLIERQLQTFKVRFLDQHPDGLGARGLHTVVVVASMLEREEPRPENRPLVAGILYKRLDNGYPLGVDATSRYDLAVWNDRSAFLANLRDEDHPYNTRHRHGLPPTAIGNPTVSSLEAAMNPESSAYWYYLHDSTGQIHPSRNAQEHEALRARYNVY